MKSEVSCQLLMWYIQKPQKLLDLLEAVFGPGGLLGPRGAIGGLQLVGPPGPTGRPNMGESGGTEGRGVALGLWGGGDRAEAWKGDGTACTGEPKGLGEGFGLVAAPRPKGLGDGVALVAAARLIGLRDGVVLAVDARLTGLRDGAVLVAAAGPTSPGNDFGPGAAAGVGTVLDNVNGCGRHPSDSRCDSSGSRAYPGDDA